MRKTITYAKLAGIVLLALLIVHFMWSNSQPVTVRLFWRDIFTEVPMFYVIFGSASGGIILSLFARQFLKVISELKHIRREEITRQKLSAEIKSKVEQEQNGKTDTVGKEA